MYKLRLLDDFIDTIYSIYCLKTNFASVSCSIESTLSYLFLIKVFYIINRLHSSTADSLLGSGTDEEEEDESRAANNSSSPAHAPHPALHSDLSHNGDTKPHEDSEDQVRTTFKREKEDEWADNSSNLVQSKLLNGDAKQHEDSEDQVRHIHENHLNLLNLLAQAKTPPILRRVILLYLETDYARLANYIFRPSFY